MTQKLRGKHKPFRSARDEVRNISLEFDTPQTRSSAYRLAFTDPQFLLREELRPIRLQLELLKPEMILHEERIHSTVVVFGSARIHEPEKSNLKLLAAEQALKADPENLLLKRDVEIAKRLVKKSFYYLEAQRLGKIISEHGQSEGKRDYVVITGGGPGIMEAANRGAHEVDAKSIGLNILLPMEQGPNPYITPELCFQFHYFAIRKMHFLIRAQALVAFPGGYGTLDELFEALTLMQTRKISRIPVLLFGREYWDRVVNFDAMVEEGTIDPGDLDLFQYVESAEEAWEAIEAFYHKVPA